MNAPLITAAVCFAWCILQVTLFAAAALVIYALVRRQHATNNVLLLTGSLAVVGALTLACWSPWPNWQIVHAATQSMSLSSALPTVGASEYKGGTPGASSDGRGDFDLTSPRPSPSLKGLRPIGLEPSQTIDATLSDEAYPWRLNLIAATWLLATFGIARFLIGLQFVRRCRQKSLPIEDGALQREFDDLCDRMKISSPVELREAPSLEVAATLGWRRPIVLFPTTWRDWSDQERRAVLAHELAHVAQRHFPLWLLGQLALAPNFYHPLVHWLSRRLRLEQELAADQLAAAIFGNRRHYTTALASLALGPTPRMSAHAAVGLFMSRPLLMRRIAMLRKPSSNIHSPSLAVKTLGPILLAAVALIAFGLRNAPDVIAEEEMLDSAPQPAASTPAPDRDERSVVALIRISSDSASLLGQPSGEQSWRVFSRTQAALLKSKFVLQAALRKPEIAKLPLVADQDDPVDWLQGNINVEFIPDTEILSVWLRGNPRDLEQMPQIVDAVVRTYMDEIVADEEQRRHVLRDALAKSYADINREIRTKLDEHNALREELGIADATQRDPEAELLMHEITESIRARAELERTLAELQSNFEVLQDQLGGPERESKSLDERLANDPNMTMLNQKLMQLQYELNTLEAETEDEESRQERARLKKLLAAEQDEIEQYRVQLKLKLRADGKDKPNQDLQRVRKEFQIRAGVLSQQLQALNKRIHEITEKLTAKNQRSVELEVGAAELEQLQQIATDMSLKLEQFDVESVAPPRVRVIQWAM